MTRPPGPDTNEPTPAAGGHPLAPAGNPPPDAVTSTPAAAPPSSAPHAGVPGGSVPSPQGGATLPCRNCGDPATGAFCPRCGQRKRDIRVSLRTFVADALEDHFSLSRGLLPTLGSLIFRPGFLTREYVEGRIVRYVRPLRLYLLTSVVFFLLVSLLGVLAFDPARVQIVTASDAVVDSLMADPSLQQDPARRDSLIAAIQQVRNTTLRIDDSFSSGFPELDTRIRARIAELNTIPPGRAYRLIVMDFLNRAPVVVFLLLPAFAGILKLLYFGSRKYYAEHLIFALHLHAFWFAVFTLMLIGRYPFFLAASFLWIFIYVFLAMKRVYGEGYLRTGVKYAALAIVYPALVALGVAATFVLALALA